MKLNGSCYKYLGHFANEAVLRAGHNTSARPSLVNDNYTVPGYKVALSSAYTETPQGGRRYYADADTPMKYGGNARNPKPFISDETKATLKKWGHNAAEFNRALGEHMLSPAPGAKRDWK